MPAIVVAWPQRRWRAGTVRAGRRASSVGPGETIVRAYVGERLARNADGILLHKDEAALLDAFVNRRDGSSLDREHVGKWLDAAARCTATRPIRLRAKLDRVAKGLIATQLDNGYLGTYGEQERWQRWISGYTSTTRWACCPTLRQPQ